MSLFIFKSTLVNALCSSIPANLNKYLCGDVWVAEVSTKSGRDMQTGVEPLGNLDLDIPGAGNLKDFENAVKFHKALKHLTPLQARDPRLWTRLAHVEFWPYMRKRWPVDKHIGNSGRACRFIKTHYFVSQSQSRALIRNGIARLWWAAHLSFDPGRSNQYELTDILFSTLDITQQILERGLGRADNVIKSFLEFLLRNRETLLAAGNKSRERIRLLAKYLNMYGGVCILDLLSRSEIMDVLDAELNRILKNEKSASAAEI